MSMRLVTLSAGVVALLFFAVDWVAAADPRETAGPAAGRFGESPPSPEAVPSPAPASPGRGLGSAVAGGADLDQAALPPAFDGQWLRSHGFASSGQALARLRALTDGRRPAAGVPRETLRPSPSAGVAGQSRTDSPSLSRQERYMQFLMNAPASAAAHSVLVRWVDVTAGAVLELSSQPVTTDPNGQMSIWLHRTDDWDVGHYRVEILSADDRLQLLARGQFDIVADGEPLTPFVWAASTSVQGGDGGAPVPP